VIYFYQRFYFYIFRKDFTKMKKLISAIIIMAMACSLFCVATSADEGVIYLHTDFSNEDYYYQNFMEGAFFVEGGTLIGYNEAKALQSFYESTEDNYFVPSSLVWRTYDASATFTVGIDDMVSDDAGRSISLSYCNDNTRAAGLVDSREFINFTYDVVAQELRLSNGGIGNVGDEGFLAEPVAKEILCDGTVSMTMGISVEEGRIRCFLDGELIFDFADPAYHIAESQGSIFIMWNENNFMQYTDITVASQGHLFPVDTPDEDTTVTETPDVNTEGTDAPEADNTDAPEADNTDAPEADNTDAPEADNTDAPGADNTDAPEADTVGTTGTQKPSTSTGDASFAVVAVMIVAFGSALVVKKVRG